MNQKGIAPLIIVAVIVAVVAVAGVGIYVATRGGGGNIAGATSLRFNLDITSGGTSTTGTVMVKNIGTDNMMLRMEGTYDSENYIWIMDEAQQKVWMYNFGRWTDFSADFSTYWSEFDQSFENYQTQLGGWTGSGEYTYTDPTSGATERFYDIEVNPELADSLFVHEGGTYSGGPISIQSDNQFTSTNGVVSGSGTQSNPYVIENWVISASTANGIYIRNTTAYFVIRNCLIENGGSFYFGIHLNNVINGRIENNTCDNNFNSIFLSSSSYDNLTNNTCDNNYSIGIALFSSYSNNLTNNTCLNNSNYGIGLHDSSNNTLTNNTCENNVDGIYLENSSNNNTLTGNYLLNNTTPYFDDGTNNVWS